MSQDLRNWSKPWGKKAIIRVCLNSTNVTRTRPTGSSSAARPVPTGGGFLKNAGLAAMGAMVGSIIPFHRNIPAHFIPSVLAGERVIRGKDGLVVINERPLNAETPAHLLDDAITPTARHFIRNNGVPPVKHGCGRMDAGHRRPGGQTDDDGHRRPQKEVRRRHPRAGAGVRRQRPRIFRSAREGRPVGPTAPWAARNGRAYGSPTSSRPLASRRTSSTPRTKAPTPTYPGRQASYPYPGACRS